MKTLLVLALFALLMITPGAVASEDPLEPVCGGAGWKQCAVNTVESLFGPCNPFYQYVRECDPTS